MASIQEEIEKAKKQFEDLNKKYEDVMATGKLPIESLTEGLNKLAEISKNVKDKFKDADTQIQALSAASLAYFGNNTRAFGAFEGSLSSGIAGLETYNQRYKEAQAVVKNLSDGTLKGLFKVPEDVKGEGRVKSFVTNILEEGLNQKKLQESILQSAATAGQLYQLPNVYKEGAIDMDNLNKLTVSYNAKLNDLISTTKISTEEGAKYMAELMKIPGGMKLVSDTVDNSGQFNKQFMTDLVNLSRATHIPVEKLMSQVSSLRDNFNLLTDEGKGGGEILKFMASLSHASNKLGIDFESLKTTVNNIGSSFKYYGDISKDSVEETYKMTKALEATGLSAKSSLELTQGFTDQISKLTMAQKAFVSQSTGGPGGLRGAFELEGLIEEGKFSEVVDKVKQTLKDRLGTIVSKEEAKGSEEAASKRYEQMLLTQQLLGPMAKGPGEAQRLMDAFSKEDRGDVQELGDSSVVLQEMLQNSKKEMESDKTIFGDIRTAVDSTKLTSQITAYNTTQLVMFAKDPKKLEGASFAPQGLAKVMEGIKKEVERAFATTPLSEKVPTAGASIVEGIPYQAAVAKSGIESVKRAGTDLFEGITNKISDFIGPKIDIGKVIKEKEKEKNLAAAEDPAKKATLKKEIKDLKLPAPPPKPNVPTKLPKLTNTTSAAAPEVRTSSASENKQSVDVLFEIKGHALCDGCMQNVIQFVTKHMDRTAEQVAAQSS